MTKKQVHVYYSGMVHGVGFRFTAEHVAGQLGLSGWVKNLPDGRVELVAEGEEKALAELLKKLRNGPLKHYIKDEEVLWSESLDEFKDFVIRFW